MFGDLSVETALAELGIYVGLSGSEANQTRQAFEYVSSVKVCMDAGSCFGAAVWELLGLKDRRLELKLSWVNTGLGFLKDTCP